MAIKKSELYSSLWASCDELRGGMDASQYKDYVLTLLFVKYISDKYKNQAYGDITVPSGASFDDMVALVGTGNIGDDINKKILNPIKEANRLSDFPDFNDENKLGKGKDLIDTVSNLILIFNDPKLNFSGNSAEGDDILGDAYEYLMRHFATESGKSKGQFYTPAEVSRVLAKVIGISAGNSSNQTKAYDPTCGSGSLLLKVMNEAGKSIELYGQEKENATAGLARMNMILHHAATAEIVAGNTLSNPAFKDGEGLKKFDYIVANPPFSLKSWSNGVATGNDPFGRFALGVPPEKNGDYAFLLHILASLKSTGKAAVVLPHGVLFRGNAEGLIRKRIIQKGYIKGIIGLPANLFYGTGIPACILVLDKEHAAHRKGIFMIDASRGFAKDGNKNRLREQDIRKVTDVFSQLLEIPGYSRMVSLTEISDAKNDFNLNIPRYIDGQEKEDLQNIEAHLQGGIPEADIDALSHYWQAFPELKAHLFQPLREGFVQLAVATEDIRRNIFYHPQFLAFQDGLHQTFEQWFEGVATRSAALQAGADSRLFIRMAGNELLKTFAGNSLLDNYDLYEHLMQYWNEVMADDVYTLSIDGWAAGRVYERLVVKGKKSKDGKAGKDKPIAGMAGIEGRLLPPSVLIDAYFLEMKLDIDQLQQRIERAQARMAEIEEEQSSEEGLFADLEKVSVVEVNRLLKEKKKEQSLQPALAAEADAAYGAEEKEATDTDVLAEYLVLADEIKSYHAKVKQQSEALENAVLAQYPKLSEAEIKDLLIHRKWKAHLQKSLASEQERVSQNLARRIQELAARYESPLPMLETAAATAGENVKAHLAKMGFVWK